jgi:triphosphoribosyl-dephospho-CoA synthase
MRTSVKLLPLFFKDIIKCHQKQLSMQQFVQTGIAAEQRMAQSIHTNAHKGFIFLSGILLMAAYLCNGQVSQIRQTIVKLAKIFFADFGSMNSRSTYINSRYGLGGVKAEIEQGLPSIFDYSWPRYKEVLDAGWSAQHSDFYLMALLMQRVEDTTAVHRCGLSGLTRLRHDGKQLQRCLENRQDPKPMLISLDQDYCKLGLTMGGVADCMALTFALQKSGILSDHLSPNDL